MSFQSSFERWDSITFWLTFIGTVLLAVGVVTGVRARGYARSLTAEQDKEAGEAQLAHDRAIAAANAQIETLRKETAEANARALEAKVELEKYKAPRLISSEQRDAFISELKPFGKQRVDVFALINHGEVVGLRDEIVAALRGANWDAVFGGVGGVAIEIRANASDALRRIANALASALRNAGLQTSGPWNSQSMASDAPMEVVVGNKP